MKSTIENCLRLGDISQAITLLLDSLSNINNQEEDYNDALLLSARWANISNEYKVLGTLKREDFEIFQSRIILGIQYILNNIKDINYRFNPKIQQYDIYISATNSETKIINEIYQSLAQNNSIFLRSKSLDEENKWIPSLTAQSLSKLSLIFVDNSGGNPAYDIQDVENALNLERNLDNRHKLVLLYTNGIPINNELLPFALRGRPFIDIIREKNLHSIIEKILNVLENWEVYNDALENIQNLHHPLKKFPRGPMVEAHMINTIIIQNYAKLIKPREALQVIAEANSLRLESDPNTPSATTIKDYQLLPVNSVTPYEFWLDAFKEARMHGPRMLAALLIVVPDYQFDPKAQEAKNNLLKIIANN